jgi:hypothetical protein
MRLADRIAQCRDPFIVRSTQSPTLTKLKGAADYTHEILGCATRYVLADELTRVCTALAYSRGARTLTCADLLHVPADRVWVEWCEAPWRTELELYGFRGEDEPAPTSGRRGALIQASRDGRRGLIRTFWTTGNRDFDVLTSSMEAYFDFDTPEGGVPFVPDEEATPPIRVCDEDLGKADILRRCFRFRFERSWAEYYARASLSSLHMDAVARHALGTIAIDIPVLLAFLLLLITRPSVPRRPLMLERINQARGKSGRPPLLQHVEVFSPILPEYRAGPGALMQTGRRSPRLHHVRGHLVRRGTQLSWRMPHLRGNARLGAVQSRTVTWTVDEQRHARPTPH